VRPVNAEPPLTPPARHFVGAVGEPAFENGWANLDPDFWAPVSFYKDRLGIVHLSGVTKTNDATSGGIFTLPTGYLPCSDGNSEIFAVQNGTGTARVDVTFSNGVAASGYADDTHLSLSGISFRAC
jgi:hypothetical protein